MRISTLLCAAALVLPISPAFADPVTAALANPARGKDGDADARRHAAALAAFANVKPGDTVVDLIPGSGYFTRIFSLLVGPKGHVYAVWPTEYMKDDPDDVKLVEALAKDPHFANVTVLTQPAGAFTVPAKADLVWTSQNYHDYPDKFMGPTDTKVLNAAVFKALRPGGTYVVIDHVAAAGSGLRDTETLHRIDPAIVKSQVLAAGFTLDSTSTALANPADKHTAKVFDASIRGKTDQFAFRFKKP
ncbi:MAG TPA: SAM-dependent methyltransferase [Kofleriaceae bacterium]|jgi:predicted methyltransferase